MPFANVQLQNLDSQEPRPPEWSLHSDWPSPCWQPAWWLNWAPASSKNQNWALLSWWFQQARDRQALVLVFSPLGKVDFIQMHLKTSGLSPDPSLWAVNCSFPNQWSLLAAHHVSEQQGFVRDQICLCVFRTSPVHHKVGGEDPLFLPYLCAAPARVPALEPVLSTVLCVHRKCKSIFQGNIQISTLRLIFMQI